jgi:hypothetical protein
MGEFNNTKIEYVFDPEHKVKLDIRLEHIIDTCEPALAKMERGRNLSEKRKGEKKHRLSEAEKKEL